MIMKFTRTKALKVLYACYRDFYHDSDPLIIMSFRRYITFFRHKTLNDLERRLIVLYFIKGSDFLYCKYKTFKKNIA